MTTYRTMTIDGVSLFYREAGPQDAPTLVLLHGFPSSSHMFRNLLPALSETFHLVAPDYPGFGNSDTPPPDQFEYTFAHLTEVIEHWLQALGLNRFSLYVHDYGAPVGFRLAFRHPDWVQAIITQNGNAYEDGLTPMWEPLKAFWQERTAATEAPLRSRLTRQATMWQYTHGVRDRNAVESINDDVLRHLNKGHTGANVAEVFDLMDQVGIPLRPSLLPFSPWETLESYIALLHFFEERRLVEHVDPVHFSIRLLVPPGSALLDAPDTQNWFGELDAAAYTYRWTHPDPRMDDLQRQVAALVEKAQRVQADPIETFFHVKALALAASSQDMCVSCALRSYGPRKILLHLTESWFC